MRTLENLPVGIQQWVIFLRHTHPPRTDLFFRTEIVQLSSRPIVKPLNKRLESIRRRRSSIEDPRHHPEHLGRREVFRLRLRLPEEVTILMDLLLTIQEGEDLHGITSLLLIAIRQAHHSLVPRLG